MKYTSLFSAVAIAAAMGTQALATTTVTTNAFEKFEGADPIASRTGWTVQTEDQSEIIAAPLSSADAVAGYTANQHLKLNTEGQELVWNPGTVSEPKAIIEMKVRLVASDTAPSITSNDVHAAVYLQVSETPDPTNDGLYAYAQGSSAPEWTKLDTSEFDHALATGDMVALRVLMDYERQTVSYEGALLADAENDVPAYVNLGTTDMANPDATVTALTSVAFKGTGGVDDLFVKQIHETPSKAGIRFEFWDAQAVIPEPQNQDFNVTNELDTAKQNDSVGTAFEYDPYSEGLEILSVELIEDGTNLTWNANATPTVDAMGNIEVSMVNYTFVAEHNYLVKVTYGLPVVKYTVTFTTAHGTVPASQQVENGSKATEPTAPTEAGWVFKGWMNGNAVWDFANDVVESDITLVASWKQLFTVTFTTDHGTAPAQQQVEDGGTATKPDDPTAEGYTFNGWKLGETAYTFTEAVTGNITLVADWTEASSAEGVEFGTFVIVDDGTTTPEFTAFSVSGTTATATLKAKIVSNGDTATSKTFYAKYTTTLGGAAQTVVATAGTPTVGDAGTVTVTFTVPSGNSLFLVGFTNDAAQ